MGGSLITSNTAGQIIFDIIPAADGSTQFLEVMNLTIDQDGDESLLYIDNSSSASNVELLNVNFTNLYVTSVAEEKPLIRGLSAPENLLMSIRECYFYNIADNGTAFDFTNFGTITMGTKLRDNTFYNANTDTINNDSAHIVTNTTSGKCTQWWSGNTFYSPIDRAVGIVYYMWLEKNPLTNAALCNVITSSIHNQETVNANPIALPTMVPLYGPNKMPAPIEFNRS